ncbi:hypothetical protein B0T26DRAFT_652335 [Lasiosphaeria miniovina]|uniref:Zn(2)-C6 fungal-type domain-containing protein n=1 Tax=Lasiosphaeria miniovina TaxID=1954250 RepID=A0AA40A588_9PEZI|nr:uncharacterized protein B0T26DRAFT_652335 [Lasiosphaeria miniovina]KAK0709396.1 hypothetical protein B0T26DRAFT_652335 [Lasiosphaeria miniovina]
MAAESTESYYGAPDNGFRRQRAHHTRARTGCDTCRIRRVRCDEQKPSCNRCVSTGRRCDGYANNFQPLVAQHSRGSSQARSRTQRQGLAPIPQSLGVPLPRHNGQELRSFHFFLDVTAPVIAGVFDADFWLTDIPRTCHLDPAIWHAAVSLGAVHESYIASQGAAQEPTAFSLQQMNAVVRHLVHLPSSRTVLEERSRALTASVIFTYLYSIQGLYSQSGLHLGAAKNLIQEIEGRRKRESRSATAQLVGSNAALTPPECFTRNALPYTLKPLLSVVANLEVHSQAIQNGGVSVTPAIFGEADIHTAWRYYTAPARISSSRLCQHGKCVPSRATPANLSRAGRAFESLLNALVTLSQQNSAEVARLVLKGEDALLSTLIRHQQPHSRAFRELDIAISVFARDTADECMCFGLANPAPTQHQKKAIDALRLYHATCYPPAHDSVDENALHLDPRAALAGHVARTLDIAESILGDESPPARADASNFTPTLPTTQPLFIMAHIHGLAPTLRRRVIELLRRYPRREGLYDSVFAAALAELSVEQERALAAQAGKGCDGGLEATSVPPLASKLYGAAVTFTGAHSARVMMQTWADWVADKPGQEVALSW